MSTVTHPLETFLKRIMTDASKGHEGTVSIGGRTVTNLSFAGEIDGLAGEEVSLLVDILSPVNHKGLHQG